MASDKAPLMPTFYSIRYAMLKNDLGLRSVELRNWSLGRGITARGAT